MVQYQSLLLSLTYTNILSEPTPGRRSISITISDGIHQDMTAVIIIVILTNDSPLTLASASAMLDFTEGDVALAVGTLSGIVLVDEDRDAMVANMTLTLMGVLEEGREQLEVSTLALDPASNGSRMGDMIVLTQLNLIQNYQVS